MRQTHLSVAALAETVKAEPSSLLTVGNPKTAKGENFGYFTAIMHLSPWKASGVNVCPSATKGCIAACLNTAGMGMYGRTHIARIRRTKWFKADKVAFMRQLEREILSHIRKSERVGLIPAIRLNGTSDLPWENVKVTFSNGFTGTIFDRFPDVQFYDYTKIAARFQKDLPSNYDLTFSLAESNSEDAENVISLGGRVAVVFGNIDRPNAQARRWNLPKRWNGRKVVDADKHDLRFLDPKGVYCGLKAKGLAGRDKTGFVNFVKPA